MGKEPLDADRRVAIGEYCQAIETYLCRKNDGHLIRVVGPTFELVSGWADQGIPLKVAFAGIDRYFERYYRKGPRRRPVRVDFCDADVLDVFDEWRRATGIGHRPSGDPNGGSDSDAHHGQPPPRSGPSLPQHLERVVLRLTSARASGALGGEFDTFIDRASAELDTARAKAGGLRGEARSALLARLDALDVEMLGAARTALDANTVDGLRTDAERDLSPFRAGMTPDAFRAAVEAAVDRGVRERFNLPVVALP